MVTLFNKNLLYPTIKPICNCSIYYISSMLTLHLSYFEDVEWLQLSLEWNRVWRCHQYSYSSQQNMETRYSYVQQVIQIIITFVLYHSQETT